MINILTGWKATGKLDKEGGERSAIQLFCFVFFICFFFRMSGLPTEYHYINRNRKTIVLSMYYAKKFLLLFCKICNYFSFNNNFNYSNKSWPSESYAAVSEPALWTNGQNNL